MWREVKDPENQLLPVDKLFSLFQNEKPIKYPQRLTASLFSPRHESGGDKMETLNRKNIRKFSSLPPPFFFFLVLLLKVCERDARRWQTAKREQVKGGSQFVFFVFASCVFPPLAFSGFFFLINRRAELQWCEDIFIFSCCLINRELWKTMWLEMMNI